MTQKSHPEPVVNVLIFNKDSKLFLMHSHKWRDGWTIPGGIDLVYKIKTEKIGLNEGAQEYTRSVIEKLVGIQDENN